METKYSNFNSVFHKKVNQGKYSLECVVVLTEDGVNIILGGGEKSHIGSVAISIPRESLKQDGKISCTTSVFNFLSHKDDALSVPMAEKLCKTLNRKVVVSAGVHIENAAENEIMLILKNLEAMEDLILTQIGEL